MWNIFKAELSYNKTFLIIIFSILTIAFIIFTVAGLIDGFRDEMLRALRGVMIAVIGVIFLNKNVKQSKEKRDRFYMQITLSAKQTGGIRIIPFGMLWLGMVLLYWLVNMITGNIWSKPFLIWDMFSLTGIVLFYNAYALLYKELTNNINSRYNKVITSSLYILLTPVLYSIFLLQTDYFNFIPYFTSLRTNLTNIYFSFPGSIVILFAGLSLTYLDILLFARSRIYLE